jgi:glucosamine kinase
MILIADSGSTKTAWIYTDGTTQETYITGGANPFFRSTADMIAEWNASSLSLLRDKVSHVYFYAAGVVNEEKAQVIEKALLVLFPGAAASVQSDLLAAAHATLGNSSGIACILGTGSNSCLYNGREITAQVPPLGFILGDEGSGAVLGRLLVGDYLKKTLPAELSRLFKDKYPYEYGEILNRVYRQEKPNMFLASLVPFLKENIEHTYCSDLVKNAFDLFITRNVAQYDGYKEQDICFAGSVAYYFQEQLKWVFSQRNLRLGEIVKEPLLNLMKYHLKQPIK